MADNSLDFKRAKFYKRPVSVENTDVDSSTTALKFIEYVRSINPNAVLIVDSPTYNLALTELRITKTNTMDRPEIPDWFCGYLVNPVKSMSAVPETPDVEAEDIYGIENFSINPENFAYIAGSGLDYPVDMCTVETSSVAGTLEYASCGNTKRGGVSINDFYVDFDTPINTPYSKIGENGSGTASGGGSGGGSSDANYISECLKGGKGLDFKFSFVPFGITLLLALIACASKFKLSSLSLIGKALLNLVSNMVMNVVTSIMSQIEALIVSYISAADAVAQILVAKFKSAKENIQSIMNSDTSFAVKLLNIKNIILDVSSTAMLVPGGENVTSVLMPMLQVLDTALSIIDTINQIDDLIHTFACASLGEGDSTVTKSTANIFKRIAGSFNNSKNGVVDAWNSSIFGGAGTTEGINSAEKQAAFKEASAVLGIPPEKIEDIVSTPDGANAMAAAAEVMTSDDSDPSSIGVTVAQVSNAIKVASTRELFGVAEFREVTRDLKKHSTIKVYDIISNLPEYKKISEYTASWSFCDNRGKNNLPVNMWHKASPVRRCVEPKLDSDMTDMLSSATLQTDVMMSKQLERASDAENKGDRVDVRGAHGKNMTCDFWWAQEHTGWSIGMQAIRVALLKILLPYIYNLNYVYYVVNKVELSDVKETLDVDSGTVNITKAWHQMPQCFDELDLAGLA